MKKRRRKTIPILILCLVLVLSGCSSSSISGNGSYENPGYLSRKEEAMAGDAAYGSADYDMAPSENMEDQTESDPNGDDAGTRTGEEPAATDNQKLVYTCNMTIETLEYEETIKSIKSSIKKYSGFTEKETETDSNSYWYYEDGKRSGSMHTDLVIRIPAANYNAFLEELSGSGKITSKDMAVENITKHYTEIQTSIKSMQIQEKRLLEMMEKAKSVEDMITVEKRLTEVQDQLAQYKNKLASMDTDVKYSTVNLTIDEVVQYEEKQDTFPERLNSTLKRSGRLFLDFLETALFAVILLGPILLVIALILVALIMVIRKIRGRRKEKKAGIPPKKEKEAETPEETSE